MATAFADTASETVQPGRPAETSSTAAVTAALQARLSRRELVRELRGKGLSGPIPADFLDDYRSQREFRSLMDAVAAVPGGMAKLRRTLVRTRVLPSADPGDRKLLESWSQWCAALRDNAALGDDPTAAEQAAIDARYTAADDFLFTAQPSTLAGTIVKLRRAAATAGEERWVQQALVDGDDATLFARAEELDPIALMLIDAIAALSALAGEK